MKKGSRINIRQIGMLIFLALVVIIFQIATKGVLLSPMNINNFIQQYSYIFIVTIGMLLVILTGNIDLSIGSVAAVCGAVAAFTIIKMGLPVPIGIIITLLAGALIGCWQGFWIAYFKIPAFIVTLSGQMLFRGVTMAILKSKTVSVFPDSYKYLASGYLPELFGKTELNGGTLNIMTAAIGITLILVLVISQIINRQSKLKLGLQVESNLSFYSKVIVSAVLIAGLTYVLATFKGIQAVLIALVLLTLVYHFITSRTIPGRQIYAYGGNAKAAQLSGIDTRLVLFGVFVNMGILAALAGIVTTGRMDAIMPDANEGLELDAIAACFIGGASSSGGIGTVLGSIVGGLFMSVLTNGMSLVGLDSPTRLMVKGGILLLAVIFDVLSKSKGSGSKQAA